MNKIVIFAIVKIIFARLKDTVGVSNSTSKSTVELLPEYSRSIGEVQLKKHYNAIISLVKSIGENLWTSYELREIMSFKSKTTFRQNYLNPAIKLRFTWIISC